MANELQTTDRTTAFQAIASDRLISAAKMSLYELVDEYQRLSNVIKANTIKSSDDDDDYGPVKHTDAGDLAHRERTIIYAAARARFGISFDTYDMGL